MKPRGGPRAAGKHAVLLLPRLLCEDTPCWTQERADPGTCGGGQERAAREARAFPQLTASGPAVGPSLGGWPNGGRLLSSGCGLARWTRPADCGRRLPRLSSSLCSVTLDQASVLVCPEQSPACRRPCTWALGRPRPDSSCPPAPAVWPGGKLGPGDRSPPRAGQAARLSPFLSFTASAPSPDPSCAYSSRSYVCLKAHISAWFPFFIS